MTSSNIGSAAEAIVKIRALIEADEESLRNLKKLLAETMRSALTDKEGLEGAKQTLTPDPVGPVDKEAQRKELLGKTASLLGTGSDIAGGIGDTLVGLVKTGVGIIQDVYDKMKSASPLLQSVEQLFNLAMTLFFMPLGNKLATEMLPAVIELVTSVTDMWDAFEGKSLGEMFAIAIDYGVSLFGQYFTDIGEALEDEGGLLGTIGTLITRFGNFIEHDLERFIEIGVDLLNFLFEKLPLIVGLIVEAMSLHYSLMITQIGATLAIATWNPLHYVGYSLMGVGVATGIGGTALAAVAGGKVAGMASGGHVDATPGGQLTVIAEGGEGETVVPDSKWDSVGKKTFNITINGLTMPELKDYIKEVVNDQTNENRLRSLY